MDKIRNRWRAAGPWASLVVLLALLSLPSPARGTDDLDKAAAPTAEQAARYDDCMALAESEPDAAWERANAWLSLDGGNAAEHCAAVALIAMGYEREGAERLEDLAAHLRQPYAALQTEILAQAAQAWFLAGDNQRAYDVQTAALAKTPDDVELLIDRSVTSAAANDFHAALDDLNRAQWLAPERADILVYRASAKRRLNAVISARTDVDRALKLEPDNQEALLERGNLNRLAGNDQAAREDWLRVVLIDEETPAAAAAQRSLAKLDIPPE
ncbi:MAG TPA: hypothetical protein VKN76_08390 [Kiloniellaceae bacterium]|nr:hypothetical protein [Kiloniellaceae bacterium]